MNNLFLSFIITTIAGLSTMLGTLSIFLKYEKKIKIISFSLIFSSSVMIFISIFDLIPNSFKYLFNFYELIPSIIIILIFIFFGFLFIYFIKHIITIEEGLYKVGIISMIALIIHNIPEGIITFLTTTKDFRLGLSLSLSISLHNIPEGISIFVPLYFSSRNKKKAIFYTFIAGFSEVFGAFIAWLFLSKLVNDYFFSFSFAVTAGIMLYIACYELIPSALKLCNRKLLILYFILGIIIMTLSKLLI